MGSNLLEIRLPKWFSAMLPVLALTLTGLVFWLPFGFNIGFFADEWATYASIQSGVSLTPGLRPFLLMPWYVIYHIDPNSFAGVNILMLLLIVGKSILFYLILRELDFNPFFAFGTALLALMYPVDTGVFYIGALTIQVSVFTLLLATWFLVRFWNSRQRWWWIAIWVTSIICLGLYEAVYPVFLVVPAVLVYRQKGITRRVIVASLAWLLPLIIFGLRLLGLVLTQKSALGYQSFVLSEDRSPGTLIGSLWSALRYTLVDGWVSAGQQTFIAGGWSGLRNIFKTLAGNPYWGYALVVAVVSILVLLRLRRRTATQTPARDYTVLMLAGLIIIPLAFLPYLITNLRDSHLRTLLHASQGAALTVSAGLWLLGLVLRRVKVVYMVAMAGLVIVATSSLLRQHNQYVISGQQQIPFLQSLAQAVPRFAADSTIVVVDDTPEHRLAATFNQLSSYLELSAQIIYSDPTLSGIICYPNDGQPWGYYTESCRFEADSIKVSSQDGTGREWRYNQVVVFQYDSQYGLQLAHDLSAYGVSEKAQSLYAPESHIDRVNGLPIRTFTMLGLPDFR